MEIKNLGTYGKGKLVERDDSKENEYGAQSTELSPDLVGMLMNSEHADISAKLNELYNIAVSSQRMILKIAEMLASQPRAKASTSGPEALDKGKKTYTGGLYNAQES